MVATQLADILRPLLQALGRAGIDPDHFIEQQGREGLTSFLADLPTRAVTADLLRARHAETQQRWHPNDFNDIVSLPAAAVHCDVVVTEKRWAVRMKSAKVPERHGTVVLKDLADPTPILEQAAERR